MMYKYGNTSVYKMEMMRSVYCVMRCKSEGLCVVT